MSSETDDVASTSKKMDKGKRILDEQSETEAETDVEPDDVASTLKKMDKGKRILEEQSETDDEPDDVASTSKKIKMSRCSLNEMCAAINTIPALSEDEAEEITNNFLTMDTEDGKLIDDFARKSHHFVKAMEKVEKEGNSLSPSEVLLWITSMFFSLLVDVYVKDGSVYSGLFYSILEDGAVLKKARLTYKGTSHCNVEDKVVDTLKVSIDDLVKIVSKKLTLTRDGVNWKVTVAQDDSCSNEEQPPPHTSGENNEQEEQSPPHSRGQENEQEEQSPPHSRAQENEQEEQSPPHSRAQENEQEEVTLPSRRQGPRMVLYCVELLEIITISTEIIYPTVSALIQRQPNIPYSGQGQPNYPYRGQGQQNYPYHGQWQQTIPSGGQWQQGFPSGGQWQQSLPHSGQEQQSFPYSGQEQEQQGLPYSGQWQQTIPRTSFPRGHSLSSQNPHHLGSAPSGHAPMFPGYFRPTGPPMFRRYFRLSGPPMFPGYLRPLRPQMFPGYSRPPGPPMFPGDFRPPGPDTSDQQ